MLKAEEIRTLAEKVSRRYPEHIRDEIYSAAVEGILIALRRYNPTKGSSIKPFVLAYAKGYAQKEWERWKKPFLSLDYEYESKEDGFTLSDLIGEEDKGFERVELEEVMRKVATNEEERELLRCLDEGMGIKETAKALGKSRTWVWMKIKELRKRCKYNL